MNRAAERYFSTDLYLHSESPPLRRCQTCGGTSPERCRENVLQSGTDS